MIPPRGGDRGQSNVIAVVLLIAITLTGVTVSVALGSQALSDAGAAADLDRAEHAMTQLDSMASLVALGAHDSQRTTISLDGKGSSLRIEERGWMNVSIYNETEGSVEDVIMNATLGAIVYDHGQTTIAYQGGGVWREGPGGGSVMVSPPEFHYRVDNGERPTLTLPLVVINGSAQSLSEDIVIRANGTDSKYPIDGASNRVNPLEGGAVNVTVQSEYYVAWGQFFEERTGGTVFYDHDSETVTIVLEPPPADTPAVAAGLTATTGDELQISGKTIVDSYDSSQGSYSPNDDGKLATAGSIRLSGQADVNGSLESGDWVEIKGNSRVRGNVAYTNSGGTIKESNVDGWVNDNASVPQLDPVDLKVAETISEIRGTNNNGVENVTDDNALDFSEDEITLTGGDYYFNQSFQIQNDQKLLLDTSDGDIRIAVDDQDIQIDGGNITVTGPNRVEFFLEEQLQVQNGGDVWVPGHNSTRLWVYGGSNAEFQFEGQGSDDSVFVGAVYAPTESTSSSRVQIKNHAVIYGGIVGGDAELKQQAELHFDEALLHENPIGGGGDPTTVNLQYLHVSVSSVEITGD